MASLGDMVCPVCGRDIPVEDAKIHGTQITYTGICPDDGEVEVTE